MKREQTYMDTRPTADGLQFMPPFGASSPLGVNYTTNHASCARKVRGLRNLRRLGNTVIDLDSVVMVCGKAVLLAGWGWQGVGDSAADHAPARGAPPATIAILASSALTAWMRSTSAPTPMGIFIFFSAIRHASAKCDIMSGMKGDKTRTGPKTNPFWRLAALLALMAALVVIFLLLGIDPRCEVGLLPWTVE